MSNSYEFDASSWLRNNYHRYSNIGETCDALSIQLRNAKDKQTLQSQTAQAADDWKPDDDAVLLCVACSEEIASTNQPVQAKALTDQQIRGIAHDIKKKGLAYYDLAFARAIEAALLAAQPSAQADVAAVREDWKLVPIDPTDEMTFIGQSMRYDSSNSIGSIYCAMLDAAPTAQPQGDAGKDRI